MNKQPGSTIVTTIKGSQSCYITTNWFAFLSVEAILTGTIHFYNDILNWFWILFKSVNPRTKRQETGFCLIFKRNIPHLAHRCALRALIIASAERLKNPFVQAQFTQALCIWTIHVPYENKSAIVIHTIGVNALHIVIALKNVTLVSDKKSILVEMFDFAVTLVDNFCKNELIAVMFKLFDEKTRLVFFKPRRQPSLPVYMLNYILVTMTEQFVFCFCKTNLKFWFG